MRYIWGAPLALSLLLAACDARETETPEPAPAPPEAATPEPAPATPLSEPIVEAELADDVPVYPGATPTQPTLARGPGTRASFESSDDIALVYTFYQEALPRAGWEVTREVDLGGEMLIGAHKEARQLSVALHSDGGKTKVLLLLIRG